MKKIIFVFDHSACLTISAHAKDIVDTAVDAGRFKTLATALGAAGLCQSAAS